MEDLENAIDSLTSSVDSLISFLSGFSGGGEIFLFGLAGCVCAGMLVYALLSG